MGKYLGCHLSKSVQNMDLIYVEELPVHTRKHACMQSTYTQLSIVHGKAHLHKDTPPNIYKW